MPDSDPASMPPQNKCHPQSRVRLDCSSHSGPLRLGCSPLRPRRMYEEPQADRILRSLSSCEVSTGCFEESRDGTWVIRG